MSIQSIGSQSIQHDPSVHESSQTVHDVQDALSQLGYSVPRDGVFNQQTEQALRRFQHSQRLPETGAIDQPTVEALNGRAQQHSQQAQQTATPALSDAERGRRTHELRWEGAAREGAVRGQAPHPGLTAAPSGREQVRATIGPQAGSQSQAQLQRSIDHAGSLMENPPARGQGSWQDRIDDGRGEMRGVAARFEGPGGAQIYSRLSPERREQVWRNVLMSDDISTGRSMMQSLRAQDPRVAEQAAQDLHRADQSVHRDHHPPALNAPVHTSADILRGLDQPSAEQRAGQVEEAAAAAGDPRPGPVSTADAAQYTRIMQRAMTRSDLEAHGEAARNPRLAAFVTALGGITSPTDGAGIAQSSAEQILERSAVATPLSHLGRIQTIVDTVHTYERATDPEARLRANLREAAMEEAGGNPVRAQQILNHMLQTEQRMQADQTWLRHHPEHPLHRSEQQEYRPAPPDGIEVQ